jgi:hypothetical protein
MAELDPVASLLTILCLFTKSTTIFVIPLAVLALILALLPQPKRIFGWVSFSLLVVLFTLIYIPFDGLAGWHKESADMQLNRAIDEITPHGKSSLEMEAPIDKSSFTTVQLIPFSDIINLKGKTITIGVWMWASSPIQTRTPIIDDGADRYFETVTLGTTPEFYAYSVAINDQPGPLMVRLQTSRQLEGGQVSVYYDGIVLVEGDYSQEGVPSFLDMNADLGTWGGDHFTNYVRNASFERGAPQLRPQVDMLLASYLPVRLSNVISSLFDPEGYRSYYSISMQHLFRTFWAVFGWGEVNLVGSKPYRILLIISLIALTGDGIYIWKKRRELPIHILGFLGLALVGVWGMATIRGVNSVFTDPFIPAARYAYPAIAPTVLLFVVGWREILKIIGERLHLPKCLQHAVYISFFVILNVVSIYSIYLYYNPGQ